MTIDKAYLLGLLIGGGKITYNSFVIKMPFKKWGLDPANMSTIAVDILTTICGKFRKEFNISVNYEIGTNYWAIIPLASENIAEIKSTLELYNLPVNGILINQVDLRKIKEELSAPFDEGFLSGIFDTRTSVVLSHRRFNNDAPTVSIEIPGSIINYQFVIDLCSWLTQKGSVTDQILFNHPCQHSPTDPEYSSWKKGFKIRFLVNSFLAKYSFAMQAKSITVQELVDLQEKSEQVPCIDRKIRRPSPVSVHYDLNSESLPEKVRNKLFFHYFHFCAIYGCPYAPVKELKAVVSDYRDLIFILPRMQKGNIEEMKKKYNFLHELYFNHLELIKQENNIEQALSDSRLEQYYELKQSLAFLFSETLNGKRHTGPLERILKENLTNTFLIIGDLISFTPLLLINTENNRAAIISAQSSVYNQEKIETNIEVSNLEVKYLGK